MNGIFFALVLIAFLVAGWRQITWVPPSIDAVSPMQTLANGMVETAGSSVTLAIGLIGVMALFLGLMKVAEEGGMLTIIAKTIRPLMVRLFPEVPANHPAMGAMILNMSANALGLGNAATPFGIRAMQELDKLNAHKGTATNAMALFLAINTSSVTLLPTGVIALRAAAGSADPAGILPTTLFATVCSTTVAIIACLILQRRWKTPAQITPPEEVTEPDTSIDHGEALPDAADDTYPLWVSLAALAGIAALVPVTILHGRTISPWIIPGLMVGLLGFGVAKKVRIYEAFVEGAKDGFKVAIRIIPYLVAILVAVGMFRNSGALEAVITAIGPITTLFGMPPEALPMAMLRPLSGSGAYGVLASIIQDPNIGPDSYAGYLVSTLQGSTETTFYVLAVYFGAVQIRRIRHALIAALCADAAGIAAAVFICFFLFGSL
ncbi:MAG: nucleoside recognition domain-containing protein [Pseudomonadota bacterium]|nr:nucleoside recognition domain-containing protein [Pseudomonadota bacterium]